MALKPPNIVDVQKYLYGLILKALDLEVRLEEDEAVYDLHYIARKLAQVSSYSEQLSDLCLQLTRYNLQVIQCTKSARLLIKTWQARLANSDAYHQVPSGGKTAWMTMQLEPYNRLLGAWEVVEKSVHEVKTALADRAQMLKRLDSDLRLHQRIVEARTVQTGVPGDIAEWGLPVQDV